MRTIGQNVSMSRFLVTIMVHSWLILMASLFFRRKAIQTKGVRGVKLHRSAGNHINTSVTEDLNFCPKYYYIYIAIFYIKMAAS